jgi:hypothetical protein
LWVVLGVQAGVILVWGVVLFLAPQATAALWPWALKPLTGQVVGAWLVAIGVIAAHVGWENDYGRVYAAMTG